MIKQKVYLLLKKLDQLSNVNINFVPVLLLFIPANCYCKTYCNSYCNSFALSSVDKVKRKVLKRKVLY